MEDVLLDVRSESKFEVLEIISNTKHSYSRRDEPTTHDPNSNSFSPITLVCSPHGDRFLDLDKKLDKTPEVASMT